MHHKYSRKSKISYIPCDILLIPLFYAFDFSLNAKQQRKRIITNWSKTIWKTVHCMHSAALTNKSGKYQILNGQGERERDALSAHVHTKRTDYCTLFHFPVLFTAFTYKPCIFTIVYCRWFLINYVHACKIVLLT